jgi:hypothetical protein
MLAQAFTAWHQSYNDKHPAVSLALLGEKSDPTKGSHLQRKQPSYVESFPKSTELLVKI